ncbi:hypothetical protein [Kitasatospora sp. NPDC056531]|uniref:hypothetical protein n=1 Tax=Kitasatospora sp. NPDC056531 TaxID=3345856 RepID=UPI00367A5665
MMRSDGNLVIYDASGSPVCSSNTFGAGGACAVIQDDGNFVVYQGAPVRRAMLPPAEEVQALHWVLRAAPSPWVGLLVGGSALVLVACCVQAARIWLGLAGPPRSPVRRGGATVTRARRRPPTA